MTVGPVAHGPLRPGRACAVFLLVPGLFVSAAAPAAELPPPRGPSLEVGVRGGLLLAFGDDFRGVSLATSSRYSSFLPVGLDLGLRFSSGLGLFVYSDYGAGLGKTCAVGTSCSGHLLRFGAEAAFHSRKGGSVDPWVGLGFGYEIATLSQAPAGGPETTTTLRGFELLHLQLGVEVAAGPAVRAGPFLQLALSRYTSATASQGGVDFSPAIQNPSLHELLTAGLRVAFAAGP